MPDISDQESKEKTTAEPVHFWETIAAIKTTLADQSKKVMNTYSKEIGDFVTVLKEEASEAIHIQEEAIKFQFGTARDETSGLSEKLNWETGIIVDVFNDTFGISVDEPAGSQEKGTDFVTVDSAFLLSDHATNANWKEFKSVETQPLLDVHKQAILANDSNLLELHEELVPKMLSEERFWNGWLFFRYLAKNQFMEQTSTQKPKSPTEWESWENEELVTPTTNIVKANNSDDAKDGWDDWE